MFCQKCGTELPEGAIFCGKCGTNQQSFKQADVRISNSHSTPNFASVNPVKKNLDSLSKIIQPRFYIILGAVIVAIMAIILVSKMNGKTVDFNDYTTVTFEGYNTRGRATYVFDEEAFFDKYAKVLKKNGVTKANKAKWYEFFFIDSQIKFDKESDLSNDEEVVLTWSIDEKKLKDEFGLKSKTKDKKYKVKGLETVKIFDAFDGITVEFSGMAPNGMATVSGGTADGINFYVENNGSLSNGDKAKVCVSYSYLSEDDYIQQYGRMPQEMSREYTVEGLDEYISRYDNVPDELLTKMKKDSEDIIVAHNAKSFSDEEMTGFEYAGYIFCGARSDGKISINTPNILYLIYKANIVDKAGGFSVYYPVSFYSIVRKEGNTEYEKCGGIEGYSDIYIGDSILHSTKGYINPALAYMELATERKDEYDVQSGDGFDIYSDYKKVTNIASIDDLEELESNMVEFVKEYFDDLEKYVHVDDLNVMGEYLLIAKHQENDYENDNRLYVICCGTVVSDKNDFEPTTVYFPMCIGHISGMPDGEWMFEEFVSIEGETNLRSNVRAYIWGYTDGTKMYKDIITANRDKYTYEMTESLKQFGN